MTMNDIVGSLHLVIGLMFLALAVMIPARAQNIAGGLVLTLLFAAGAVERFALGYYRMSGRDILDSDAASFLLVWTSLVALSLFVLVVLAWRAPERSAQLDRMEKAALDDQADGREHRHPKAKPPGD